MTDADDGRRIRVVEGTTEDERTASLHLVFEGNHPLPECVHLLGRPRRSGGLTLHGVSGQQVLTHGCSSRWCGPFPALTLLTNGAGPQGHPGRNCPERSAPP